MEFMDGILEFLIVGRRPLGAALRAAVLGALGVTVGRWFLDGWVAPLVFGVVLAFIVLPLAHSLAGRD